jgi:hypothetical protein
MVCELCDKPFDKEKRKLTVRGKTFYVHDICLRKATKRQLVAKKIIKKDDFCWRL